MTRQDVHVNTVVNAYSGPSSHHGTSLRRSGQGRPLPEPIPKTDVEQVCEASRLVRISR